MTKEQQKKQEIGIVKKQGLSENLAKTVFLGIGSNIGNRIKNIEKAKYFLSRQNLRLISVSSYYETPSWPNPKNPRFLNIVIKLKCNYLPLELLKICKDIEIILGRKKAKRNAPRVCDIDIIDFNGLSSKIGNMMNLPHKSMHKRNFVLFPLFEVQKNWVHPIKQNNVKKLIYRLPDKDIRSIKKI